MAVKRDTKTKTDRSLEDRMTEYTKRVRQKGYILAENPKRPKSDGKSQDPIQGDPMTNLKTNDQRP